jgi:hypothetical protein
MFYAIGLIILGALAAYPVVVRKQPAAQQILDRIVPFQGFIGVIFGIWGIWGIIQALLNMGLLTSFPIWWITWMAVSVITAILGFLLGFGLINKYVTGSNPELQSKANVLRDKLVGHQINLGFAAIALGIWGFVASTFLL